MSATRRAAAVLTVLALAAAACTGGGGGGDGGEPRATGTPSSPEDRESRTYRPLFPPSLGACHGTPPPAPADAFRTLRRPGAWLRVDRISAPTGPPRRRPAVISAGGSYLVTGGDERVVRQLPGVVEFVYTWNTTALAIEEALRLGGTVSVHTGANGDAREVAYAVAVRGDEVAFLGECAYDSLTVPVRDRLGQHAARYLRAMEGKPAAEVARVLAVPPERAELLLADHDRRVIEGAGEKAPFPGLRTAWFTVRAPASWRGAAAVCPVIELGRFECVPARGPATGPRVRIWFDPAEPTVEVRLYRTSPPYRPVGLLATVDVRRLAAGAGLDATKEIVLVHVDLAASPSLGDVLADPRRARDAVTLVRVARCSVERCAV